MNSYDFVSPPSQPIDEATLALIAVQLERLEMSARFVAEEGMSPLHVAADRHIKSLAVAVRFAFAATRKAIAKVTQAMVEAKAAAVLERELMLVLPGALTRCAVEGARVAATGLRALGGPGSGNFGHEGRPGLVGGSGQGDAQPMTIAEARDAKFVLQPYQETAIADGHSILLRVPLSDTVENDEYTPQGGLKADNEVVQRMKKSAEADHWFQVPEGYLNTKGKWEIADGKHRRLAFILAGRKTMPLIVPADSLKRPWKVEFGLRANDFRFAKKSVQFNAINKRAATWAKKHAAEMIVDITETSRKRIKAAIASLLEGESYRSILDKIAKAVGDDDRAELIARHETMTAVSAGQREAWAQAVEDDLLDDGTRRVWIATPIGACPVCEKLDGKTAKLGGTYPGGSLGPPEHVACRCTEGLQ